MSLILDWGDGAFFPPVDFIGQLDVGRLDERHASQHSFGLVGPSVAVKFGKFVRKLKKITPNNDAG